MKTINTRLEVLNGWKEIARHLGTSVRSAQRYERLAGLPIRRPAARSRGAVLATKSELDAWVTASPLKEAFSLRPVPPQNYAVALEALKTGMAEQRRLREEMKSGREELHRVVELLHATLVVVEDGFFGKFERQPTSAISVSKKIM